MFKIVRANVWWNSIVSPTMGWVYFCLLLNSNIRQLNTEAAIHILLFFVALVSVAAFGYLFNDWCDVSSDIASGKKNLLAKLPAIYRIMVVTAPLALGLWAWPFNYTYATFFFALQVIALVIYSAPPFRLKSKVWAGVCCDAFYAHVNPVVITLLYFNFFGTQFSAFQITFLSVLISVLSMKGVRNILLHQLSDRKNDFRAGISTAVLKIGPLGTLRLINHLLRYEIVSTIILAVLMAIYSPPFFISLLLFALITYLKFSGWKLAYLPKRQLMHKFLYFLNDYHENWVPVFLLILLSIYFPPYLFLLLLHFVLFPNFIIQLWRDVAIIKQNFATEEDY